MDKLTKYTSTKASKVEDRILRFIGSDEKVDLDGDKVMTEGWDLKNYRKNPVVLFAHQYHEVPVARTKKVQVKDKQLLFDIEFPTPEISSVGDSLFKLYDSGFMKAVSVGFRPDYAKITYPENSKDKTSRIINGQTLLEISLVSVGTNSRALLTSKSMAPALEKNIIDELELRELQDCFGDEELQKAQIKIAQLELELCEKQMEDEEEPYKTLYDEFSLAFGDGKVSERRAHKDELIDEVLTTLRR